MKHQILKQKIGVFVIMAIIFAFYSTLAEAHGDLEFNEGNTTTREIAENTAAGTDIGEPLRYSIGIFDTCVRVWLRGPDAHAFEIVHVYRGVQLKTKSALDYETKNTYEVIVIASGSGLFNTDSITVTISVTDVNEVPFLLEETEFVEIPDTSLATMIRLTLGLSTSDRITEEKMLELTRLDAGPKSRLIGLREIEDLTGLESAPNLTTLLLGSNSVKDLTPLKGLTKLTTLEVYSNYVFSLAPLENLTNLKSLHLGFNQIRDITPLKNLTNLMTLRLLGNSIRDLTPLKGLNSLTQLDLMGNIIEDVSALSGLTNLRELLLENNRRLRDASPLASLVNLEKLSLKGCPIEDTSPLVNLTSDIDINVSVGSSPAVYGNIMNSLLDPAVVKKLNRKVLQTLLKKLSVESKGSLKYQKEIAMLRKLLASMRPEKTLLLANYPNPFNPETWIPYHLAYASNVEISIYNMHGTAIKHLDLGYQQAGYHTNRKEAAYWDGTDDLGKRVASGPYFYQMHADNVSPIRKMVILK